MTLELLIHSIVRQTTILIARLATSGGVRAPLAQVADQVFYHLVRELEQQGVSRRVCADMFGLGLRTYQRKIHRLNESLTDQGRSLWKATLDFIQEEDMVTRSVILKRFSRDDESQVKSVLHDLCESRLVFSSGSGAQTVYRATSKDELESFQKVESGEGLDELIWALIYRLGPIGMKDLMGDAGGDDDQFSASVERLVATGRVERTQVQSGDLYSAKDLVIPLGAPAGWEGAVFDHYKAVLSTITARLATENQSNTKENSGGCTFTLEVWEGHPYAKEVYATLGRLRAQLTEQRAKVEKYNSEHQIPEDHTRVLIYAGQSLIDEGNREPRK